MPRKKIKDLKYPKAGSGKAKPKVGRTKESRSGTNSGSFSAFISRGWQPGRVESKHGGKTMSARNDLTKHRKKRRK